MKFNGTLDLKATSLKPSRPNSPFLGQELVGNVSDFV